MLRIIFISCPAILLAGYGVYKGREILMETKSIEINDLTYLSILFITMFAAYWVTSSGILKEIFSRSDNNEQ